MSVINTYHSTDQRQKTLLFGIIISFLFHIALFWLIENRHWLIINTRSISESIPQQLTITFPENKLIDKREPREVVQNINENDEIPDESDLLSERNSRARNPEKTNLRGATPLSSGNSPFSNLSGASSNRALRSRTQRHFSSQALTGETSRKPRVRMDQSGEAGAQAQASQGSNQMLEQKKFSVEEVGALSLSTYKWRWAPYINAMKNKLNRVWYAPPAYYQLGLIHGYTIIKYTIDRKGNLVSIRVLKHDGHQSLEVSSSEAIKALFPFLELPDDFPDETLTVTAKLLYPDLRRGR